MRNPLITTMQWVGFSPSRTTSNILECFWQGLQRSRVIIAQYGIYLPSLEGGESMDPDQSRPASVEGLTIVAQIKNQRAALSSQRLFPLLRSVGLRGFRARRAAS
jgi:hypothetical protein